MKTSKIKRVRKQKKFDNKFLNICFSNAIKQESHVLNKNISNNEYSKIIETTSNNFLLKPEWKDLRLKVLEKYGKKCQKCGTNGSEKNRINVDHIKPRKFFPNLALEFDNLQVLCSICNKEKGNLNYIDYRNNNGQRHI